MAIWNRWWRQQRRRRKREDALSTAAPVNTVPPSITDGGNGLLILDYGKWDNLPTRFDMNWKISGNVVGHGDSFVLPAGKNKADVTLDIIASNDNGSTTITLGNVSLPSAPPLFGILL